MKNRFLSRDISAKQAGGGGFTLIELLIVVAILGVLAAAVTIILNPAELLAQARDAQRESDLDILNKSLSLYSVQNPGASMGTVNTVYVSIADVSSTCGDLHLPTLPTGWVYGCSTNPKSSTSGWIPISFNAIPTNSLPYLPIDPVDTASTGLYYTYVTNGQQWQLSAMPESQKFTASLMQSANPNYPDFFVQGSNLALSPIHVSNIGLAAYWMLNEGSGSTENDSSGNGNTGTIGGGSSWIAGSPNGSGSSVVYNGSNYASTNISFPTSGSMGGWLYATAYTAWAAPMGWKNGAGTPYVVIDNAGAGGTGNWDTAFAPNGAQINVTDAAAIVQNTWQQVYLTWNYSGGKWTIILYVNGVSQGSNTLNDVAGALTTFYMGSSHGRDSISGPDGRVMSVFIPASFRKPKFRLYITPNNNFLIFPIVIYGKQKGL